MNDKEILKEVLEEINNNLEFVTDDKELDRLNKKSIKKAIALTRAGCEKKLKESREIFGLWREELLDKKEEQKAEFLEFLKDLEGRWIPDGIKIKKKIKELEK